MRIETEINSCCLLHDLRVSSAPALLWCGVSLLVHSAVTIFGCESLKLFYLNTDFWPSKISLHSPFSGRNYPCCKRFSTESIEAQLFNFYSGEILCACVYTECVNTQQRDSRLPGEEDLFGTDHRHKDRYR